MHFNPRWIAGKTVARVDMNTVRDGSSSGHASHNPVIIFDDGSKIWFNVIEGSDKYGNEYGMSIGYAKPTRKGK